MGCDIHGTIEVAIDYGSRYEWAMVSDIGGISSRIYALFGYLFGVRGACETGCARRGYPHDVSWRTQDVYNGYCDGDHAGPCGDHQQDWHSLTYMTWNELKPHMGQIRDIIGNDKRWNLTFDLMEWLAERSCEQGSRVIESTNVPALTGGEYDTSKVRLIVWFDN